MTHGIPLELRPQTLVMQINSMHFLAYKLTSIQDTMEKVAELHQQTTTRGQLKQRLQIGRKKDRAWTLSLQLHRVS